jgi:hypothetical protein
VLVVFVLLPAAQRFHLAVRIAVQERFDLDAARERSRPTSRSSTGCAHEAGYERILII